MIDLNTVKSAITALIDKASKAEDAGDAMKFAQAAMNASQAMYALRDVSADQPKG